MRTGKRGGPGDLFGFGTIPMIGRHWLRLKGLIAEAVLLSLLALPLPARAISEVWAARNANGTIDRFALDGTWLGEIDVSPMGSGTGMSMQVVGDEVWVGLSDTSIQRIAFDTMLLGNFGATGMSDVVAITVVPEPSAGLLVLGGLVIVRLGRARLRRA